MALKNFNVFTLLDAGNINATAQIRVIPSAIQSVLTERTGVSVTTRQVGNVTTHKGVTKFITQVSIIDDDNSITNYINGSKIGLELLRSNPVIDVFFIEKIKTLSGTTGNAVIDITIPITKALVVTPPGLITDVIPGLVGLRLVQSADFETETLYNIVTNGDIAVSSTGGIRLSITPTIYFHAQEATVIVQPPVNGEALDAKGKWDLKATTTYVKAANPNAIYTLESIYSPLSLEILKNGASVSADPNFQIIESGIIPPATDIRFNSNLYTLSGGVANNRVIALHYAPETTGVGYREYAFTDTNGGLGYDSFTVVADLTLLNNTGSTILANTIVGNLDVFKAAITL